MRATFRTLKILAALLVFAACPPARAQEARVAQREAIRLCNEAKQVEAEAGKLPPNAAHESYGQCTQLAIRSYAHSASKLALWRILSCASRAEKHLTAWAAMNEFKLRYGVDIETFEHDSFDEEEVARVPNAAHETRRQIGAVQVVVPETWTLDWADARPFDLSTSQWLGLASATLVSRGEVVFGLVGTSQTVLATHETGTKVPIAIRFQPLSSHDVVFVTPALSDSREDALAPPPVVAHAPEGPPVAEIAEPKVAVRSLPKCRVTDADLPVEPTAYDGKRSTGRNVTLTAVGAGLGLLGAYTLADASKVYDNDRSSREYNVLGKSGAMAIGVGTLVIGAVVLMFPVANSIRGHRAKRSLERARRKRREELEQQGDCVAELPVGRPHTAEFRITHGQRAPQAHGASFQGAGLPSNAVASMRTPCLVCAAVTP